MNKSYERREKVARAIQRELGTLIQQGGVKDDRLDKFISIIDVDLNSSLSSARVIYSIMSKDDKDIGGQGTQAALDDSAGYLRGVVGRKLNLRYAPKLIFIASDALSKAVDMVGLIDRTVNEDKVKKEQSDNN
jgi:ribosome-binding factor A